MSKVSLLRRSVLPLLIFSCLPVHAQDAEEQLTHYGSAASDYQVGLNKQPTDPAYKKRSSIQHGQITDADFEARRRWYASRYGDTDMVLKVEEDRLSELYKAGKWEEAANTAKRLIDQHPESSLLRARLLYLLVRTVNNNEATAVVRKAAFDALLSRARNAPSMLAACGNYLAGNASLSPEERYKLAEQGAEMAGSSPEARDFLWRFLAALAQASPDAAKGPIEEFLRKYPEESLTSRAARETLLELQGNDPGALAKLRDETKAAQAEVARLCAQADSAALAGDFATVGKCFDALAAQPSWAADVPWWGKFVDSHGETLPPALVAKAIGIVPAGDAGRDLGSAVLKNKLNYQEAGGIHLILLSLAKYSDDIERDGSSLRFYFRGMKDVLTDDKLRLEVSRKMTEIALGLGMKDAAAEFLFDSGKLELADDPAAARPLIEQAASLAPGTVSSVDAAWLLALLDGKLSVATTLASRNTLPGTGSEPPSVELPKNVAPDQPGVIAENGTYSLRKQDTQADLASWSGRFGSKSRSTESWEPESLPASLMVPLDQAATLKDVKVRLSSPSKFAISLLDASGRVLARAGRDWPFWDPSDLQTAWPDGEQTVGFSPVAGARFIRIDLYEAMSDVPGIESVEAHGTAYVAQGAVHLDPQKLPPGSRSVTVRWQAQCPSSREMYDLSSESFMPYPIARWRRPWSAKVMANELGVVFRGANPHLVISGGPGRLIWSLDGAPAETFEQPEKDKMNAPAVVKNAPGDGRQQMLRLKKDWLNGSAGLTLGRLIVDGSARAGVRIRFGSGTSWEEWQGPFFGGDAQVAPGGPASQYQAEIVLDSRAIQAEQTPTLSSLDIIPQGTLPARLSSPAVDDTTFLPERLDEVAKSLASRSVAVAYPKAGTRGEYELARRLAERAGAYLISDDVALTLEGQYNGPILAVGTPRDNRLARQLLWQCNLWNDPDFLNNKNGVVGKYDDVTGDTFYFVTGDTPEAVEKAGERLLDKVPQFAAGGQPFRVFPANSLETLYPWQSHSERKDSGALEMRMAVNDRRSSVFGVESNTGLSSLDVSVSALKGQEGQTLPPPMVRAVAGYEWMSFLGDLRLPNFLLPKPVLPLPANTTQAYWVTVRTPSGAKPGTYSAMVTVTSGSYTQSFPLQVNVLPVPLPDFPRIDTMSYAAVPWWYLPGTVAFDRATRELAENECEKRVNTVMPRMVFTWKPAANELPARYAIGAPASVPDQLKWLGFTSLPKTIPAGQALFVEFPSEIAPAEIGGGVISTDAGIRLAAVPGTDSAPVQPTVNGDWGVVRIPYAGVKSKVFRLESGDGASFQSGMIRAFPDRDHPIVAYDFSPTLHQMDIFEDVYKKAGLALPNFHVPVGNILGPQVAGSLFGVGGTQTGGGALATDFTRQFRDQLHKKGRDERTILKVGDEPHSLTKWAEMARPYKEGGLHVMTAHGTGSPEEKDAVGVMNPWCPNYEHNLFDPLIRAQQKAGDRVWWYQCGVPATRLTGWLADNLPIYWLTAKWNLDGVANFAALSGSETGSEGSPIPFRYDHGLHYRMYYLPDGTLVDSPRREVEAEGIKDYTLIEFVRDQIDRLKKQGRTESANALEGKLDAVIASVVPSIRGYPVAAKPWLDARNELYDLAAQSLL